MSGMPFHQDKRILAWFYATLVAAALACWLVASLTTRRDISMSGGCAQDVNGSLERSHHHLARAITFCSKGDDDQAVVQSGLLPRGTARVDIEISGYTGTPGVQLVLQSINGERRVAPLPAAGEHWRSSTLLIPRTFRATPFRLLLEDSASTRQSWAGLAIVSYSTLRLDTKTLAGVLAGLALLHFLTLELSALASRFCGDRHAPMLGLIILGLLSYLAFWAYFASRSYGTVVSALVMLVLLGHACWRMLSLDGYRQPHMEGLHYSLAPVTIATLLLTVVSFYPFPASWDTWQYAASRWIHLPIDNWLPLILADQVWAGSIARPMIGDWLSSDRPPLQAGFALLLRLPAHRNSWYEVASTWLQLSFLIPVAQMLPRLGLQKARSVVLLVLATSALALHNGSFVWPKLIAATYCLIFYITAASSDRASSSIPLTILLAGGSAALAMLAHGGALFALIGIAGMSMLGRMHRKWTILLGVGVTAAVIYAPWIIYQHVIDPPGTRLLAWHLAGVQSVTAEPVASVIRHAYDELTLTQWLDGRWTNVRTLFAGGWNVYPTALQALMEGARSQAAELLRNTSFRYFFYAQWFFPPLLWLLFLCPRCASGKPRDEVARQLGAVAIGLLCWSLLIFTPGETIIHQGSYSLNIMALLLAMAASHGVSRWLFRILAALNLLIFARIYVAAPHAIPQDGMAGLPSGSGIDWLYLVICLAIFLALYRVSRASKQVDMRDQLQVRESARTEDRTPSATGTAG